MVSGIIRQQCGYQLNVFDFPYRFHDDPAALFRMILVVLLLCRGSLIMLTKIINATYEKSISKEIVR